ncbi:membrane protein insertion efficiency factor YidD [Actinomarinicola tropica]|uniref:Putative membrane protein insertion efficiency factor n=1 Tax=Actinomarinicola tropica TaxID=2789776 RepID=A0A5Q2RVG7_9ACTN|nr:membrane protein insertion efficiency factor YidD [Actinomarinicola tropica]
MAGSAASDGDRTRPSAPARLLLAAVRGYRRARAGRPSPCRYYPSCSTYALEALEVHGAARGAWLTARRIGRCQPWGGHGIDLVPPRSSAEDTPRPPSRDARRKAN